MIKRFAFTFAAIIFAFSTVFTQEQYVKPVDQADSNPSFAAFRTNLIAAVKRKDAKYVLSIVDPKIRINFGDGGGIIQFKKEWKNLSPTSAFWGEFLPVVSNGGMFSKEAYEKDGMFWAPYTFDAFPPELDATEYSAIFGKDVNLRSAARTDAPIVTTLSYNIVKIDRDSSIPVPREEGSYLWYKVETLGGLKGFVKAEYVRSPIDYRACFEKKRGKWVMTAFVAGD
jgi:hypothetical protein